MSIFRKLFVPGTAASAALAITLSVASAASGPPGNLPADPPRNGPPDDVPMQSILWQAEQLADRASRGEEGLTPVGLRDELAARSIKVVSDNLIHVEIVGPEGADAATDLVSLPEQFGGELSGTWRHRADALVPINRLSQLARKLPSGYFMERAHPVSEDHEGTTTINTDSYLAANRDGSGITIAVIDSGYSTFAASRSAGDFPPAAQTTTEDDHGIGLPFPGTSTHGTGSVESAFAHAPGADYILYRVNGITQSAQAVDDAISRGANIITHSLSRYNQGWADNSGDAVAYANDAADNGLLFFTSAGNRANQHWQGTMNPGTNDWHNFGSGETIRMWAPNGRGANFYLQWETASGSYDYDLYLYDDSVDNVLASSTSSTNNVFETFGYTNSTGSGQWVRLAVRREGGGNTDLEVFTHGGFGNYDQVVSAGSITSPSNSTRANVVSNAAVDHSNHDSPNDTDGIIMGYSSRGPSNGGSTRPDLSGPTNVSTTCCGGSFGGTSSATPNNAGAAAALWSAHPDWNASAVRWLLFKKAELFKNWGPGSSKSNIYGMGGTVLMDYMNKQTWLARSFFNTTDADWGPYYTLEGAYNAAPANANILVFPGGNYLETFNISGKSATIISIENAARFGN